MPVIEPEKLNERSLELGGLRFEVYFTKGWGPTTRVLGQRDGEWVEVLRFDDFAVMPHYHAPAESDAIMFDRGTLGDPMEWYLGQVRDNLTDLLGKNGNADVLPTIDQAVVTEQIDQLREAMSSCVPEGFTRVPGIGLRHSRLEEVAAFDQLLGNLLAAPPTHE